MNKISEFISNYSKSKFSRFHMPGHKGNCSFLTPLGGEFDITEIEGADVLFESSGIIAEVEKRISDLYGLQSVISAGGSTLCIQTMVSLVQNRHIIAMRNSHAAFFNACALIGKQPNWIFPEIENSSIITPLPSLEKIEFHLKSCKKPAALYLTSPDYLGRRLDIARISKLCKKYNALLLVDNAHGAHLKFLSEDVHPCSLGADLCCDSLHKTMPALTGAAILHFNPNLFNKKDVKSKMSLFGSSSPSYLVMQSIGLCADWLMKSGKSSFLKLEKTVNSFKKLPGVLNTDCSKICIDAHVYGLSGKDLARHFRNCKIEPEYADSRYLLLMPSPFSKSEDFVKLKKAFKKTPKYPPLKTGSDMPLIKVPEVKFSIRDAALCESESIPVCLAKGKVCAENKFLCPPGIPLVVCGEIIDKDICNTLKNSGIYYISVVK